MAPLNLKGIFLPALIYALLRSRTQPLKETPLEDEYDYVIIGSGWGGSVVANRLSEDSSVKVALLEAGAKDNVSSEIPLLSLAHHGGGYDWRYKTTPQEHACWASAEKRCVMAAGKVVGGSSVLGLNIYMRGIKENYDDLGKDNPGWSYDDLLPFFKKAQDYNFNGECKEDDLHGCGGELYIGALPESAIGKTTPYFIQGSKELLDVKDMVLNGEDSVIGVGMGQYSIKEGVKKGAATTFLKPISKKRDNLHISPNTLVLKIVIDPETKKATGVEYEKDGAVHTVKAKREVILSAGVYASPKLLLLSGIGAKEQLDKYKIPVISDLPGVGKNYRDVLSSIILFWTGKDMDEEQLNIMSTPTIRKWAKGEGMLISPSGFDALASHRTALADEREGVPDIMFGFQSLELHAIMEPFLQTTIAYEDKYWEQFFKKIVNKLTMNVQPCIQTENPDASISLSSADPHDPPIIDPKFFEDEKEGKRLREAMRMAMKYADTSLFKENGYQLLNETFDECKDIADRTSDEYLTCFLKYATILKWSGCCTNKMGPDSDNMAVVDNRLRVKGVTGLRVVDASVMIKQVSALPAATVIAIGEKAADMIMADNKR